MSAAPPYSNQAGANDDQERSDKKIRWHHEGQAGFAEAAKIDDHDHEKNTDAKRQRMRLQGRNSRDERANAGGNSDGCGENVVREQSGRRQQAGKCSQIEPRHGIRTASSWIGGNRLKIRKINDDE